MWDAAGFLFCMWEKYSATLNLLGSFLYNLFCINIECFTRRNCEQILCLYETAIFHRCAVSFIFRVIYIQTLVLFNAINIVLAICGLKLSYQILLKWQRKRGSGAPNHALAQALCDRTVMRTHVMNDYCLIPMTGWEFWLSIRMDYCFKISDFHTAIIVSQITDFNFVSFCKFVTILRCSFQGHGTPSLVYFAKILSPRYLKRTTINL